jgi:hypothetical protein
MFQEDVTTNLIQYSSYWLEDFNPGLFLHLLMFFLFHGMGRWEKRWLKK